MNLLWYIIPKYIMLPHYYMAYKRELSWAIWKHFDIWSHNNKEKAYIMPYTRPKMIKFLKRLIDISLLKIYDIMPFLVISKQKVLKALSDIDATPAITAI